MTAEAEVDAFKKTAAASFSDHTQSIQPPPQWPDEVIQQYEPIRTLGHGGFASVMLARKKVTGSSCNGTGGEKDKNNSKQQQQQQDHLLAAIKVVGSKDASTAERGYAHREVDILRELSHPNIMKVIDFWELDHHSKHNNKCAAVMALSYSKGPTIEHLIKYGGAVSICFGRVVMAQLVDALAYCHGRAVIHRDIKPDNCVITGASAKQDEIWNDNNSNITTSFEKYTADDWKKLCHKWHLTLIDFGFARALSPDDLEREKVTMKTATTTTPSGPNSNTDNSTGSASSLSRSRRRRMSLDKSISHALKRSMSALGNRMYAAPEIINNVQDDASTSDRFDSRHSIGRSFDITKTLSHHVANYGMLVDAYSMGNTIKYMMTGVPPNQNVTEVIANYNNPIAKACRWLTSKACGSSSVGTNNGDLISRDYQYRGWKDLPEELVRLIHGTTNASVSQRTSVRAARRYPWIDDVLQYKDKETGNIGANNSNTDNNMAAIDFLQCTLKHSSKKTNNKNSSESAATLEHMPPIGVTIDES